MEGIPAENMIDRFIEEERIKKDKMYNKNERKSHDEGHRDRLLMLDYNDSHPPVVKIKNGHVYIIGSNRTFNFTHRLIALIEKVMKRELSEAERVVYREVSILITTSTRWRDQVDTPIPNFTMTYPDEEEDWKMDDVMETVEEREVVEKEKVKVLG